MVETAGTVRPHLRPARQILPLCRTVVAQAEYRMQVVMHLVAQAAAENRSERRAVEDAPAWAAGAAPEAGAADASLPTGFVAKNPTREVRA